MTVINMSDLDLRGRRVLIREDLNLPVREGEITSEARLLAALPTIRAARDAGAAVMVISHLGRPDEGRNALQQPEFSLGLVARRMAELLGTPVRFEQDWLDGVEVEPGAVVLLENVRFNVGEIANDDGLARRMAALCDIFVMDAFGTSHRAQASTHGVARHAPIACAGPLLVAELDALATALTDPARPVLAIVGGAKVSSKLTVLGRLAVIADQVIVGGGIANTFLAAAGNPVGKSLVENDLIDEANQIASAVAIPLPVDVMTATELNDTAIAHARPVADVAADEMILDVGPETARQFAEIVAQAGTIIWNGPLGVFEVDQFGEGTKVLAQAIAAASGFSIAGGGDTLAAIDKYGVGAGVSYISTGGGAFLEFVEGKTLPAVAMLEQRARG